MSNIFEMGEAITRSNAFNAIFSSTIHRFFFFLQTSTSQLAS